MNGWHVAESPLKFGLGDKTLWSARLRLLNRALPLLSQPEAVQALAPPDVPLPAGCDGYMERGRAVAVEQPRVRVAGSTICYVVGQYRHCYIDLSLGFQRYQAQFSGKTRSTIGRKVRKFAEATGGALQWKVYREPAQMADFLAAARSVSARSYQERLLDAGIPDGPAFLESLTAAAAANRVRGYVLFDGTRPVSYLHCPVEEGSLIYAHLGYDPDYAKLSAGTVLQWLALESIFDEGSFRFFDFTEGQSDHKRLFATGDALEVNVMYLRNTWRNRALVRAHTACDRFSEGVGDVLQRYGLKARVRRLLRFGLTPGMRTPTP